MNNPAEPLRQPIARASLRPQVLLELLAVTGGLVYLGQALTYLNNQRSSLDEGLYLLKGFLFAAGRYAPYQDYGPWMNKLPFAFLFPGAPQVLFGPSLLTGRIVALALALLMLLALWLTARRLAGPGWGAAVVWAVALNPALGKIYAQAISQGLAACILVWALFFALGEDRKPWQVALGSALTAVLVMTRENLLPVVPLLVLYVFWARGKRLGLISLAAAALPLLFFHALYWPAVLRNWVKWMPRSLTPFLDAFRIPGTGEKALVESVSPLTNLFVFFEGLRFHFLALGGAAASLLLWAPRRAWRSDERFKLAVFLTALLAVLTAAHLWASLGGDYCVYCYSLYLGFFSPLGLLLAAVSFSSWRRAAGPLCSLLAIGVVLLAGAGLGYAAYHSVYRLSLYPELERWVMALQVPRMKDMRILPGQVELWSMLSNRFGWSFERFKLEILPQILPAVLGLLFAALLIGLTAIGLRLWRKAGRPSYAFTLVTVFLLLGALLSPTWVLGGGMTTFDCQPGVIQAVEAAGRSISARIPPGATLDWRGGVAPTVLLYIPQAQIYPPQLNSDYSYYLGGDSDQLFRYGFWNEELSARWLENSDYLLVEAKASAALQERIAAAGYRELDPPPPVEYCPQPVELRLFEKR